LKLKYKKQRESIYTFWCIREKKKRKKIVTNNKPEDGKVIVPTEQQILPT